MHFKIEWSPCPLQWASILFDKVGKSFKAFTVAVSFEIRTG
jgi:hypothetical protein